MDKEKINLITATILILTIGLVSGYAMGYFRATRNHFPEIQVIDEINPGTATIKLMEVKNGKLYGKISGRDARLAYSPNDIITLERESEFEVPLNAVSLKSYYQAKDIPENIQFIASKNGKYYYSIFEKQALNLSPQNRIYFSSASEAEKMGYIKK